jgi:hypothetical protein
MPSRKGKHKNEQEGGLKMRDRLRHKRKGEFEALAGPDLSALNPNGGVLVVTTYWRPRAGDPNPEQPGEKLSALSYLPTDAQDQCPCGSGNCFGNCCQLFPYWRPVCPNPGRQGYSLLRPQSACFPSLSNEAVVDFLHNDERLYCVEEKPRRIHWLYWGDPALDELPYGTLCFGDLELHDHRSLLISALSDARLDTFLDLLRPLHLGRPKRQRDPLPRLPKPGQRALGGKYQSSFEWK